MRLLRISVVSLAAAAVAGCAKKPEPVADQTQTRAPVPPSVFDIHAADFAFQSPDTITGGWVTLRLDNTGKELHHAALFRLEQGKTVADLAKLGPTDPIPAWLVAAGGPNAATPGAPPVETTLKLAPGSYVIMCAIPSSDLLPHFMKGMVKPLTVVAPKAEAIPPVADVSVKLVDYGFQFSQPLSAGKHTIRVEGGAGQPHEFLVAKLEPGKTAMDLAKWVEKMAGPPPAMIAGGTAPLGAGELAVVTIDFSPGEYAIVCFVPDVKDGKPHAVHGMIQQIKIS